MPENLWVDVVNEKTGEHSLKTHELKIVFKACDFGNHNYEEIDHGKRIVSCTKCGYERSYILGPERLINGKIVDMRPSK